MFLRRLRHRPSCPWLCSWTPEPMYPWKVLVESFPEWPCTPLDSNLMVHATRSRDEAKIVCGRSATRFSASETSPRATTILSFSSRSFCMHLPDTSTKHAQPRRYDSREGTSRFRADSAPFGRRRRRRTGVEHGRAEGVPCSRLTLSPATKRHALDHSIAWADFRSKDSAH